VNGAATDERIRGEERVAAMASRRLIPALLAVTMAMGPFSGVRAQRMGRLAWVAAAGVALGFAVYGIALLWVALGIPGTVGIDLHTYQAAAARWIAGDGFYNASQLAGPYQIVGSTTSYIGDVLYPPTMLYLFVPFTVLPEILWWAIPAALIAVSLRRMQPARWTWPLLALLVTLPYSERTIITGNPVMWIVALTWLGAAYGWGGAFVWLKPSLFPFALFGIRRRGWWMSCGLLAILTLPFLPMVFDYARVMLHVQSSLLYSLPQVPLLLTPLVAWAGRRRDARLEHGPDVREPPEPPSTARPEQEGEDALRPVDEVEVLRDRRSDSARHIRWSERGRERPVAMKDLAIRNRDHRETGIQQMGGKIGDRDDLRPCHSIVRHLD
jgi:hypothetical protein